jgi:uncharacterized protein YecE (DUF72 family)
MVRIGTAGWTIPTKRAAIVSGPSTSRPESHLERYARLLRCVEINSSFYRSHRETTWLRWAVSTPDSFRFSVKFPRSITHLAKLTVNSQTLDAFFREVSKLGEKLGAILVQLPPSLSFDDCIAGKFFAALRERTEIDIALEPRHATWFTAGAEELMKSHRIARVAADPSRNPSDEPGNIPRPGGWAGTRYFRLHGSPRTYYSKYEPAYLEALARSVSTGFAAQTTWVIFDNTALGHAFANALELEALVSPLAEDHITRSSQSASQISR